MPNRNDQDDQLDILLNQLNQDHDLDKKMDAFSQDHDKEYQGPVLTKADLDDEEDYGPDESAPQEEEGEGTMVFSPGAIHEADQKTARTVTISNEEIQNFIEEEKGPALKRERVSRPARKKDSRKTDWKTAAIIMAIIGGVALCGLLIFGIYQGMNGLFSHIGSDTISQEEKDKLMAWASALSDDVDGKEVKSFESTYNKLSDQDKQELNKILKEKTGKTYDELLAETKSGQKADKDNNNTQVAEQKAKIRSQIADLKEELAKAQAELDAAKTKVSDAAGKLNAAQSDYNNAQAAVNDIYSQINSVNAQIADQQNTITELQNTDTTDMTDAERIQLQKDTTDAINTLRSLQSQADSLSGQLDSANRTLASAQTALDQAQGAVDALQGTTDAPQAKVDSINQQISDLQSQLDSLK